MVRERCAGHRQGVIAELMTHNPGHNLLEHPDNAALYTCNRKLEVFKEKLEGFAKLG